MQEDPEDPAPEWWYDPTNKKLAAAFDKLERKKQFGVLLKKLHWPVDRLGWVLVPVTMAITAIAGQVSQASAKVVGISLAAYILGGMLLIWNNGRTTENLKASIRRGAYGFAVMWVFDAEWAILHDALSAHLNLEAVISRKDPRINQIIARYLTDTPNERRAFRTANGLAVGHQAHVALHTAARIAARAVQAIDETSTPATA